MVLDVSVSEVKLREEPKADGYVRQKLDPASSKDMYKEVYTLSSEEFYKKYGSATPTKILQYLLADHERQCCACAAARAA